jgi:hypothetical protein
LTAPRAGVWAWCAVISLVLTTPALAYGDPAAYGIVFQILTPLVLLWRVGLRRIRMVLARIFSYFFRRRAASPDMLPPDQ